MLLAPAFVRTVSFSFVVCEGLVNIRERLDFYFGDFDDANGLSFAVDEDLLIANIWKRVIIPLILFC